MTDGELWPLLEDRINCLTSLAETRYTDNEGREPPWYEREPRWHIYKCQDQLSIASYHYRQDNATEYEINMADALNHMIMAMLCYGNEHDEACHPVMSEVSE